ncbi:MAG: 3-dehydroquinate synthase [bacterium]
MQILNVDLAERSYDIFVGCNLEEAGERISALGGDLRKLLIVTNPTVKSLHLLRLLRGLRDLYDVAVAEVPDGEEYKSLKWAGKLYDALCEHGADRRSGVVAFGGGVIGDLAGFVAATYMRGIKFIQVPTTLLAQVDSSVGGKVAVNHPRAKNLIGTFYQPNLVLIDTSLLQTLPPRELRGGLAEVIKYGIIADPDFFSYLEGNIGRALDLDGDVLTECVATSCRIKANIVKMDERDWGIRAILNFGHTIGHAVETLTGYGTYRHGEAVAFGMIGATKIAEEMGLLNPYRARRIVDLIQRVAPAEIPHLDPEEVWGAMSLDKKSLGGTVRFVLTPDIGRAVVSDKVSKDMVARAIRF